MPPANDRRSANEAYTLLQDPDFLADLADAAKAAGKTEVRARRIARQCLREIAATPSNLVLRPAAALARFIYTRSYEPELDVNSGALAKLRELSRDHLLLFLWSHKSHMDSFVFLLSVYENDFEPVPLVFAGLNMNFLGFGALARRVGAIFLRRSFQDDPIYKLVFRHYIDYLISNRLPLTWSIEGTRSRTGKLSPPKLGILNWVLEACERQGADKVKLVPVSIAFDRIAEIDDYVALQRGLPKRKESLRWFLNFIFSMQEPHGRIYVRFADPVGLPAAAAGAGVEDADSQAEGPSLATRLAFEVCTRIEQITPIKSEDVLAMVLLGANGRALTLDELFRQTGEIAELVGERELPVAQGFSLDTLEQVSAALLSMRGAKLVRSFDGGSAPVYYIPDEQQLAAAYYRNTITHYFLAAALGEIALALMLNRDPVVSEAALLARVEQLRDLYKFEFFFRPREEFRAEVSASIRRRYPDWQRDKATLLARMREQPPQFGHAILRSISEAYRVVATALVTLDSHEVADTKRFTRELLEQGQELLLRHRISSSSAVSRDLFGTGLQLAEHRQLINAGDQDCAARRRSFEAEIGEVLEAINRLQAIYDEAWFQRRAPAG